MASINNTKLQWIKFVLILSQLLLLAFTAEWLHSQYYNEKDELREDVTKLFTDMQQHISDSLLLTNVIDPVIGGSQQKDGKQAIATNEEKVAALPMSSRELSLTLQKVAHVSNAQQKRLLGLDTIAFNDLFTSQMQNNGWNFTANWINNKDSGKQAGDNIFIRSNFFTHEKGIVINNYSGYLFKEILPQLCFVIVLLSLTGAGSWLTYRSLRQQVKLGRLKDDFISNMSHELKTPITTVKVALEALNNFNMIGDPKLSREYLGMAVLEMDRLELLATQALNTSLLESCKLYIKQEPYDLKKLTEDVITLLQLRLHQYDATISLQTTGSDFLSSIDKLHTQGVLINIIDNSLKYGIAPVHINIALTETNDKIQLSVSDNGPGIPEEYKDKVFEKFFRVPANNTHNAKGYGLGLSYAAQIMQQHKGKIQVSNITGGGCMFTLTF